MVYVSFPGLRPFRHVATSLVCLSLIACSTDGLSPSARIDTTSSVGAIEPIAAGDSPPGDVSAAYPSGGETVRGAARNNGQALSVATPVAASQRLPMIDSQEGQVVDTGAPATGGTLVPPQGVNMDAMLGVQTDAQPRIVGLAEAQSDEIAEGNATQPVVGGIGGNDVRQLGGGQTLQLASADPGYDPDLPPLSQEKLAARKATDAAMLEQQQRVMLRKQQAEQEQQVAFLPRVDNPLTVPDAPDRMPASEVSCRQRLKKMGVEFRDIPRISNGRACGIDYPVELSGLSGGIDVKPAVKLNCEVTEAFAKWVKNELAPSARYRYLSGVKTIKPLGGYSCRTMNSKRGNPMSEHAHGNAIDVGKFVLKSGKEIDVRKPGFFAFREKGLLKAVRSDSCKYFNTVLGPGSDPHHKDHFHFDLRERKSGYRHCD